MRSDISRIYEARQIFKRGHAHTSTLQEAFESWLKEQYGVTYCLTPRQFGDVFEYNTEVTVVDPVKYTMFVLTYP